MLKDGEYSSEVGGEMMMADEPRDATGVMSDERDDYDGAVVYCARGVMK